MSNHMRNASVSPKPTSGTNLASWAVRNLIFPIWVRRDHPAFARYFKEFQRTQFLDRTELEQLQFQRLRNLLRHANATCPFYTHRLLQAGISPDGVTSLEQYFRLPVLTKRDIQDNGPQLVASGFSQEQKVRNQTGGSTGSP